MAIAAVDSKYERLAAGFRARCRPLSLGLSIGHPIGTVGSIGPFVRLRGGQEGFLSGAFVLAPKGARSNDAVHQPGPLDQDVLTGQTRVAILAEIVAAKPGEGNQVDVAAAALLEGVGKIGNVIPPGCPDSGARIREVIGPDKLSIGNQVAFVGRTSGYSEGRVTALELNNLVIGMSDSTAHLAFNGAIEITGDNGEPFSRGGDGGALVYRRSDHGAIGIVFASSAGKHAFTYVLPLRPTLEALGAQLLDVDANVAAEAVKAS